MGRDYMALCCFFKIIILECAWQRVTCLVIYEALNQRGWGNKINNNSIKEKLKGLRKFKEISELETTEDKVKVMSDFLKCKINIYDEINYLQSIGEYENEINIMAYLNHCYPLLKRTEVFDYDEFRNSAITVKRF